MAKKNRTATEFLIQKYEELEQKYNEANADRGYAELQLEGLQNELRRVKAEHEQECKELQDRLDEIMKRTTGIVDLHKPTVIRKVSCWPQSTIRSWLQDNTQNNQEALNFGQRMMGYSDELLYQFASEKMTKSYYSNGIELEERKCAFTLSVPSETGRAIMFYAPNYSRETLIPMRKDIGESAWTTASEKECKDYIIKEFKARLVKAVDYLADQIKNSAEEDDD